MAKTLCNLLSDCAQNWFDILNALLTECISVYTVREHDMFSLHVCVADNESVQCR